MKVTTSSHNSLHFFYCVLILVLIIYFVVFNLLVRSKTALCLAIRFKSTAIVVVSKPKMKVCSKTCPKRII